MDINNEYGCSAIHKSLLPLLKDSVTAILAEDYHHSRVSKNENLLMAQVQEAYINGDNVFRL